MSGLNGSDGWGAKGKRGRLPVRPLTPYSMKGREDMAYNLQVTTEDVQFNCKYQNLSKYKRPEVVAKNSKGDVVKERTTYQGKVLGQGATQRQWTDDDGNVYSKAELEFTFEGEPVQENSQTKVLQIEGYQPLVNYTDNYVIDKYYEIYPSDNGMKKDIDRKVAISTNAAHMYKLWEKLMNEQTVARGEFCVSSKGFMASDGYIRAISIEGKWGLEIGVFKEEKIFEHLQEGTPSQIKTAVQAGLKKRLKMV